MLGRKRRDQLELYVVGPLAQLVSEEHGLARVDRFLDLGRLREVVANWYWAGQRSTGHRPGGGGSVDARWPACRDRSRLTADAGAEAIVLEFFDGT